MYRHSMSDSEIISSTHQEPYLYVNGERVKVSRECRADMTLNDFLREVVCLPGTKVMCREAGCGCCVVAASYPDAKSKKMVTKSVSTCITPLYSCLGWHITTIEGVGSTGGDKGMHPIQSKMVEQFGSQCGYCSPGFVMTMYSRLQQEPAPKAEEIEDLFDGNICRCTGYRPILDAMKSFGDASATDIEDLQQPRCCKKPAIAEGEEELPHYNLQTVARGWQGERFYSPNNIQDLYRLLERHRDDEGVRLVCGNTSAGVFKEDYKAAKVLINVRNIPELHYIEVKLDSLEIGSTMTLHELITEFQTQAKEDATNFDYLDQVATHWLRVANTHVRNNASWAGNLMMKHAHKEFPSDVFTTLEAAGAVLMVGPSTAPSGKLQEYTLTDFLECDMRGRLIVAMRLPAAKAGAVYRSFKITPRRQNAHAYVNAAMNIRVDRADNHRVVSRPHLVYSGVNDKFIHASKTENYLQNKNLADPATMDGAMETLESEVNPTVDDPTHSSVAHRRTLCTNLLYKAMIACLGEQAPENAQSGAPTLQHPMSSGQQVFTESEGDNPIGKSLPKDSAPKQVTGEAVYTNDMPPAKNELYMAYVLSQEANATIKKIDISGAMKVPEVVRVVTGKDLVEAGFDLHFNKDLIFPSPYREEVLCLEKVHYAGQPVAMVLATSQPAANRGADLVEVELDQDDSPVLSVEEAILKNRYHDDSFFHPDVVKGDPEKALKEAPIQIEGEVKQDEQFHYYMETQVSRCVPDEEGYEMITSTQWPGILQPVIANMLKVPMKNVKVACTRLGGSFGGKFGRSIQTVASVAAAAKLTKRPVRMAMDMNRNMEMFGKRFSNIVKYKVGCDEKGRLLSVMADVFVDGGWNNNEFWASGELYVSMDNAFHCDNWKITNKTCFTDKPVTTACRGPGPFPAAVVINCILDNVAHRLNLDPIDVKRTNLYEDGFMTVWGHPCENSNFQRMWADIFKDGEIEQRKKEIEEFNAANKYRKRGLDVSAASYQMDYMSFINNTCYLQVYMDGTVHMVHCGSEMGQGINLKSMQMVAGTLDIPVSLIETTANSTLMGAAGPTGGSIGSEMCAQTALIAAEELKAKMAPVKAALPEGASWQDLVKACYGKLVDLSVRAVWHAEPKGENDRKFLYNSTGVGATEVELDCLTGEYQVRRADIIMDCGKCINPGVDVGQIEGAFVMGLGSLFTEKNVYDQDSGALLTNGTWTYKPPETHCIPVDFRVRILDNTENPRGLLRTKAIGEPPICLSATGPMALKRCIEAFRKAQGKPNTYLEMSFPMSPDKVLEMCAVDKTDRKLK